MEIAGIDQRLIDWPSTRGQQIADALLVPVAVYEKRQGALAGGAGRVRARLPASDRTRLPNRTAGRSLTEPRDGLRRSAMRAFGARTVYRLAQRARAAVWGRAQPVFDIALVAIGTVAVVYVMRCAFTRRHLLAEACTRAFVHAQADRALDSSAGVTRRSP
jgi:hypothetical protein